MIAASELILRPSGAVYHLDLLPGQVAPTIITVGDPARVRAVSDHFDHIELRVTAREFVTHTGTLAGQRLSVISTGIGTDNIDIVINELDALFNIDLARREVKAQITPLTFVRLGTSGALQAELPTGSLLLSSAALALDGLLPFYPAEATDPLAEDLASWLAAGGTPLPVPVRIVRPVLPPAIAAAGLPTGITLTAAGFYAPQGRSLRLPAGLSRPLRQRLRAWRAPSGEQLTNLEMETAGIYGLATALGHRSASLSAILANRATGSFSQEPAAVVQRLIQQGLELILASGQ